MQFNVSLQEQFRGWSVVDAVQQIDDEMLSFDHIDLVKKPCFRHIGRIRDIRIS
jgi:hypothetical protein